MGREPLFYTKIAKRKVCQTLYFFFFSDFFNEILIIHAIRPGLSGTVPDFDTLSRCPRNYEIVPEI